MNHSPYKNFEEFFKKATGNKPYPYQKRLANGDTLDVINMPTGTGKTETAILGLWLWKRINGEDAPRRLIYCLPMRVLAEQTETRVRKWLKNIGLDKKIGVELLMGGSETKIQNILPHKEYIIIGTQDMLISGALNRAYGNSQFAWPIIFGLLNNDCMWIMDEVQIMENALPTSIQLNHFRNHFKTYGPHKTVWMSATINPDWLETVDSSNKSLKIYSLEDGDSNESLKKRNNAPKTLHKASITLKKEYNKKDVQTLLKLHKPGTITAIMVNTVKRAQDLYRILSKDGSTNCKLIHSRFRDDDRKKLNEWINQLCDNVTEDKIIISTQVLEAGVDVSVRTMITELAPWANLVQRFGRCNRCGKLAEADVHWIDLDKNSYLPYDKDDLKYARDKLDKLAGQSISPSNLPGVKEQKFFDAVLRQRDMINLFDTTADLSGNHTDVSRFVRTMKRQLDVNVFWRDNINDKKDRFKPERAEICNVSISDLKNFLKKNNKHGHVWNYAYGEWERVYHNDLFPGQTVVLDSKIGGYSKTYGWDEKINDSVDIVGKSQSEHESHDDNRTSISRKPVTLENHTMHVLSEMDIFLDIALFDDDIKNAIRIAVKYHDVGKAHVEFQKLLKKNIDDEKQNKDTVWAKSSSGSQHNMSNTKQKTANSPTKTASERSDRIGFRHEVASALAYLKQDDKLGAELKNLVAYLIMSHHGKVRLSLRNFSRKKNRNQDGRYLLGIKTDGDVLPKFCSKVVSIEETHIDMSMANIGRDKSGNPSWVERAITLRDKYGPFRLSYMEMLIRRADWLASSKENEGEYNE